MYYRLTDDYALRAWKFVSHAMYHRYSPLPLRVNKEDFELLMQCDGEHDLAESEALIRMEKQGIILPCARSEHPSVWSRYRKYEHRFVHAMNLMLTGKCNYNCRHCFNAAENADRMAEWDYDDLIDLLDQAADCGIHSITLTGGEPMLHPHFTDIVRAIYERNMVLEKLTTNGYFLWQETLDLFKELHASPRIKISFDGIGHHDWMRGEHTMSVIVWRYLNLYPAEKAYNMVLDQRLDGHYHPTAPVCGGNRTMMAVTCEGNVVPCLQMSDYAAHFGHTFDSLKDRRLADILLQGKWFDAVCMNHYHLREQNRQCDSCEWFGHCGGGCRALGILDAGERTGKYNYTASDPLACMFFKGGWYDRVKERLSDYEIKV